MAIIDGLGLSATDRKALLAAADRGDISCNFFRRGEGSQSQGPCTTACSRMWARAAPTRPAVIGVVTGVEKMPGVLGALRGGLVDGLVTDAALALALLTG